MPRIVLEVEEGAIITVTHATKEVPETEPPAILTPDDLRGRTARRVVLDTIDAAFTTDERNIRFVEFRREEVWGGVPSLGSVDKNFENWRGNTAPHNYNASSLFKLYMEAVAKLSKP